MAQTSLAGYYAIMAVSLLCVVVSLAVVAMKEGSWINWYSLTGLQSIAMLYVFPALFMISFGPSGSYFSYSYCYTTYAAVSMATAFAYCTFPSITLRKASVAESEFHGTPWLLLLYGGLIYVPLLQAFPEYISQPREIYARFSAAGYGLNFFGSTILITLATVTYLFKRKKSIVGAAVFIVVTAVLIYLHGSKGQLIVLLLIAILYRVYVMQKRASLLAAGLILGTIATTMCITFAVFGSSKDLVNIALDMANYSDSGRNAMLVLDDENAPHSWGQLEFEDEFYSRMPKLLMPEKPRAFGQVRLAQTYFPARFRDAAGTPSFGIGMPYADFGFAAILVLSAGGLFTGCCARAITVELSRTPSPGLFLLLLFFAGIPIIPLGAGYMLPEMICLGLILNWIARTPIVSRVSETSEPSMAIQPAE